MKSKSRVVRGTAAFVISLMSALALAPIAGAADLKSKVQIHIGKPSVWSMQQAHYLLAKIHQDNRKLGTRMPSDKELDPNGINTTRLQILRTLLDVEGQYSQKTGAENESRRREEQFAVRQREDAEAMLAEKNEELDRVNSDLKKLKRKQTAKETEFEQVKKEREAKGDPTATPPIEAPQPDQVEKDLEKEVKRLNREILIKEDEKKDLGDDITAADAKVKSIAPPAFSEVSLGAGASIGADSNYMKDFITKSLGEMGKPSLAASIALDNFVGMQYEIIAKQLTLLRDEVGPDERVIFLELPSSIYTVPCKGDDYIAQVQWKVNWYYDDKQAQASMADDNREGHTNIEDVLSTRAELEKALAALSQEKKQPQQRRQQAEAVKTTFESKLRQVREQIKTLSGDTESLQKTRSEEERIQLDIEIQTQIINSAQGELADIEEKSRLIQRQVQEIGDKVDEEKWKPAFTSNVRALDVIPRQSALNVNEVHATTSQMNFLGVVKLLLGLGVRVSYQRQRELYEQFLQQEVFASGFGKGSNAFGWTFGPLPGTNRVAPGVRTTYAVLAVPREASALRIEAAGVAYHRKSAPDYDLDERRYDPASKQILDIQKFIVRVPNEHTEQFRVLSVAYSPVKAGEPVTVLVKGDYFSPQIGVLVDGVALNRCLSIANTATSDAGGDNAAVTGVTGRFELVSSHEIAMKFSMGNDKVGTPNITLVTPEHSTAINYLPLQINYQYPRMSLRWMALTEPMFIQPFSLGKNVELSEAGSYVNARLSGTGLRRNAVIRVNDRLIPVFKDRKWKLIKEATDDYVRTASAADVKTEVYKLIDELPAAGAGYVDQMIAEALLDRQRDRNVDDNQKLTEAVRRAGISDSEIAQGPRSIDKERKRRFFSHVLDLARLEDANGNHRRAIQEAAYSLYSSHQYGYLQEAFVHEILVRKFAERYADEICLKNGVRGAECTTASRRKVIQRRLEELLSDNVDPFHQDEPYHNEELYKELKQDLLKDWVLLRKTLVADRIASVKKDAKEKRSEDLTDMRARLELIETVACSEGDRHASECKDTGKSMADRVAARKARLDTDYEELYQVLKDPRYRPSAFARLLAAPPGFDETTARDNALREIAKVYEVPREDEEYAEQESTIAYRLHLKNTGGKGLNIRYKHSSSNGFEADEVKVPAKKDDPVYEVIHYAPNAGGKAALVEVSFTVDKDKPTPTIDAVNKNIARRAEPPIEEKKGKVRVSFYVSYLDRGKEKAEERDHFWVKLTAPVAPRQGNSTPPQSRQAGAATEPPATNLEIKLSPRPVITAFTLDKPAVPDDSKGSTITIEGINLQNVQKATVAGQEADIVGTPGNNSLQVTLKKGVFIKEEDAVKIPVSLTTKDGTTLTAVITINKPSKPDSEEQPRSRRRKPGTVTAGSYRKQ